ncbi:MAG: AzlD domain-containing protein [Treponema sp.]|nr:AzlD domain-containing protein [Treponema sp.]
MNNLNVYIYILLAGGVSFLIRALPSVLIRKPIKNQFIKSFLFYVPYVTLAAMTFPAIIEATQSPIAGIIALIVGIIISWFGAGLLPVACVSCLIVFVTELFLVH